MFWLEIPVLGNSQVLEIVCCDATLPNVETLFKTQS